MGSSPGPSFEELHWDVRVPEGEDVQHVMLVRRDGSRALALWRPVSVWDPDRRAPEDPGSVAVTVLMGRAGRDLTVWRPSVSERPVLRRQEARRLRLDLGADLVLVSFR